MRVETGTFGRIGARGRGGRWPAQFCWSWLACALAACSSSPRRTAAGTTTMPTSAMAATSGAGAATRSGQAGSSASPSAAGSAAQPASGRAGAAAESGGAPVSNSGSGAASGGLAAGGMGADDGDAGPSSGPSDQSSGPFPPVTDLGANGPFQSTELDNTGPNNNYTVYLPTELAPNGAKNPIVVWMSGGSTNPTLYPMLPHLATHGFVVVASNTTPNVGQEVELGQEMVAGIDWAVAENMRDGSMFFGKLDTTKIAAMGYSMGGLATFTIANDPRLTTTVHISGGNMETDRVHNLRAPAAFICGTPGDSSCNILSSDCDIAAANCDTDFMNATTPVFYANFHGGHLGILTDPYAGRISALVTGWLRWQLMADGTLKKRFVGDHCTTCEDPNWKVQAKNLQ